MNKTRKCPNCEERFSNYLAFKYHLSKTHEVMIVPKPKHSCHECNFETRNKESLKVHQKLKHTENQLKYKCKICPYEAIRKGALKSHVENVHHGKRYICELCESSFSSKSSLTDHLKADIMALCLKIRCSS